MIIARDIYRKPANPYCFQYGPRSRQRSRDQTTTIVDFSFLRPRAGLDLSDLQALTPEWKKDMEYLIMEW